MGVSHVFVDCLGAEARELSRVGGVKIPHKKETQEAAAYNAEDNDEQTESVQKTSLKSISFIQTMKRQDHQIDTS